MLGVLLAGGQGTRLRPLTDVVNKHLLPIGKYPMIYYPLWQLKQCGCCRVMIVTGTEHADDIFRALGSGTKFGMSLTYRIQDEPSGIAGAMILASPFFNNGEDVMFMLGDNIYEKSLDDYTYNRIESVNGGNAVIFTKRVKDPQRFGVVESLNGRVIKITEKPKNPKSHLVQTGCYIYRGRDGRNDVFHEISTLSISKRGQYEVTDLNNLYIKRKKLFTYEVQGWWADAGTHESYALANKLAKGITLNFG